MSDNPYSGSYQAEIYTEPERTSVAAVLSLICSLVCCIPGVSLLGAVLGVFALMAIGRSRGRVGGRGLAIAGIILGLLFTLLWVGILIGGGQAMGVYVKQMHPAIGAIFEDLDAGRYDEVRAAMSGPAASATDEELAAFHDAYAGQTGGYVGPAVQTTSELFGMFGTHAKSFEAVQGRPNFIPAFLAFDSGVVLVAVHMDPSQPRQGNGPLDSMYLDDLWVVAPDGTLVELSDYVARRSAPAPAPSPVGEAAEGTGTPQDDSAREGAGESGGEETGGEEPGADGP